MTITTYDDLKDKFTESTLNWMARTFSDDEADEFIDLAEADFNMSLRCREMEAVTDLSPTSNVYTLPTDYLEYKRVVEKASIRRRLDFITEDAVDALYPTRESGLSCNFTIIGGSLYVRGTLMNKDGTLRYNPVARNVPTMEECAGTLEGMRQRFIRMGSPSRSMVGSYQGSFLFIEKEGILLGQTYEGPRYMSLVPTGDGRLAPPGAIRQAP